MGVSLRVAASFMLVYVALVSLTAFFASGGDLPPLASTLLTNVTTTIGIIGAFYFGTQAYQAVRGGGDGADGGD
jgi:hypothetical protein